MTPADDLTESWRHAYGEAGYARVRRTAVGIAGAGGLGSNCAVCLVRSGFRRLRIFDHDRVEAANLNRQYYAADQIGRPKVEALAANLRAIHPDLAIHAVHTQLTSDNTAAAFSECDVVVEALDAPADKAMLLECLAPGGRLIVAASGLAGNGDPAGFHVHELGPSIRIVGDGISAQDPAHPVLAPRVMIAAAWQAHVVLTETLAGRVGKGDA